MTAAVQVYVQANMTAQLEVMGAARQLYRGEMERRRQNKLAKVPTVPTVITLTQITAMTRCCLIVLVFKYRMSRGDIRLPLQHSCL